MPLMRILLIVVVMAFSVPIPLCEAADLKEAISQLRAWQNRIISIRVRSTIREEAETSSMLRDSKRKIKSAMSERDWIWEDSGRFRDSCATYNDGHPTNNSTRLADIKQTYHYGFPAANPAQETPFEVTIRENALRYTESGLWIMPHWILFDNKTRTWLGDRLKNVTEAKVADDGGLQIDGTLLGQSTEGFTVNLDPQHGYLPVLAEITGANGDICRYRVDEFRELEPGFWFPWKGSLLMNSGVIFDMWEMTQVDLNTDLPDSLFVPIIGDGTYVRNAISGKSYWHGGKPPAHLLAAKVAAANPGSPQQNDNPVTGRPDRPANWSLWLVLLGLMLVAGSVWVRRRA